MNAYCISDLHAATTWPMSTVLPNGRPSRFQALLNVLAQVELDLNRYKPTDLLILGDVFHRRTFVKFSLFNDMYDALFKLAEHVRQTTILVGNHDIESDEGAHALHALSGLPSTVIVDTPQTVRLADGSDVYAIPYSYTTPAVLQAFERAPVIPVLAHYLADGMPVRDDWAVEGPLKLGELDRFPLALFGHVHKPSDLHDGRVVVVGAIQHHDFGDEGDRGALYVRDCAGGGAYVWTRATLASPVFQTCTWPRLPVPPPPGGYLRILGVPEEKLLHAKGAALALGWIDAVSVPAALPEATREALSTGLLVTETLIIDHVRRRCPELSEAAQQLLIEEGVALWREVQKG